MVGALAGVAVFASGVRPTGLFLIDLVETVIAVTLVVIVGARTPWWLLLGSAGVAGSIGLWWLPVVLAALAFVFGAWISPIDAATNVHAEVGAIGAALTAVAFSFSRLGGFTGLSALIGVGCCVAMIIGGFLALQRETRTVLSYALAGSAAVMVFASVTMAFAALGVRDTLRDGTAEARKGARLAADFETERASEALAEAADDFGSAHGRLDAWWTQPARFVPVVAQHRSAGVGLTGELAGQLDAAADDLTDIDLDRLRVSGGAVDLDAISDLREPVGRFAERFDRLEAVAADAQSVWLIDRVRVKLDELDDELLDLAPKVDDAVGAIDLLPDMLGGDGRRSYLVLLTTPSEARSLGGFIGNYAIVDVDDGRLDFVRSGRRAELESAAESAGVELSLSDELVDIYGKYGLGGEAGDPVGARSWSNLTLMPDFETFAPVAHELYNASGFDPVDGVIVADPYVLGQLTEYSGAVETLDGSNLRGDELVDYLLLGQYEFGDRLDALDVLSKRIIEAFLDADLPRPIRLARDLGPLVDEQRLLVWTDRPAEAELLDSLGVGSGLPEITGADAFVLGINNAAGNKLDVFLQSSVEVERVETDAGPVVRATVQLHNTAPTEGFVDYVIGNRLDLPAGTHRLLLVVYASDTVAEATLDGETVFLDIGRDGDWHVGEHFVVLAPGERATIVYELAALHPGDGILQRLQPMVRRD